MISFILVVVLIILIFAISIGFIIDKIEWNKGKCKCGSDWVYFDTDSQGGRGYQCKKCGKFIWISYPIDKKSPSY